MGLDKMLMKFLFTGVVIILLLGGSVFAGMEITPEIKSNDFDFSAIDQLLEDSAPKLNGLALIIFKDGECIYDEGFSGLTTDSVVPIASASKWLSAGCLMSVIDNGTLSLDSKASDFLENFELEKGNMTIRQMFSLTSGLPGYTPGYNALNDPILTNKEITLEESVDLISEIDLIADPGAELWYGALSMQVAGRIAEMAAEEPWMELFDEHIATPLMMPNTDFYAFGETTNPRIASGIQSSARDYVNFLQMILNDGMFNGTRVLSSNSVRQIVQDQTRNATIMYTPWEKYEDIKPGCSETRYGIGCWMEEIDSNTGVAIQASSPGAFGFAPWIDFKHNICGVLAAKNLFLNVAPVYFEMKDLLIQILDDSNTPPNSPVIDGPSSGRAGRNYYYQFSATDLDCNDVYFFIDWGDGTVEEWIGPYASGEEITASHRWSDNGTYMCRAQAKDVFDAESDWSVMEIHMPYYRNIKYQSNSHPVLSFFFNLFSETLRANILIKP